MNKNIIKVGVLLSVSIIPDISLTSPVFDLYSDNRMRQVCGFHMKPTLVQISRMQDGQSSLDLPGLVASATAGISVQSVLTSVSDDYCVLESIVRKIQQGKPIPSEFSMVIDEDFWDLI